MGRASHAKRGPIRAGSPCTTMHHQSSRCRRTPTAGTPQGEACLERPHRFFRETASWANNERKGKRVEGQGRGFLTRDSGEVSSLVLLAFATCPPRGATFVSCLNGWTLTLRPTMTMKATTKIPTRDDLFTLLTTRPARAASVRCGSC